MDFLCLPNWLTLKTEETEHDYVVEALPLPKSERCPKCGCGPELLQRHGTRRQFARDAPVRGKRVRIYFNRQRYKCPKCEYFFPQHLHGIDERRGATERFVTYVERESLRRTFITVADDVGVSPNTVRSIFADFAERCTKSTRFETPRILGIDEVYIARVARCILTDISERRVLEILPKRNMLTVIRYLIQIPDKERIEAVTIDMWRPFYTVIRKALPRVEIVIDTYHVQRMANQAITALLCRIREKMTLKERREHLFDRFVLLKRAYSLSQAQKETLTKWKEIVPEVGVAYELKEEFLEIWSLSSRSEAEARYRGWREKIPSSLEPAFGKLIVSMRNWHREIFNYFDHRVSNAFTESANNIVKSMQRQGRTYSYEIIRAKMLYGGAFVPRRPPYSLDKAKENDSLKSKVKRKRRYRSDPSPESPHSTVTRLKRARDSQDQFNKLMPRDEGWQDRFQHHLKPSEDR